MHGSRTIRITKRDGTHEAFDRRKFAGALWRAMDGRGGCPELADHLAEAVELYLRCRSRRRTSSAALFEMAVRVLRAVHLPAALEAFERHQVRRADRRRRLTLHHDNGKVTLWDKSWLAEHARRSWNVSRTTARIIAGHIEAELLRRRLAMVTREDVVAMLNAQMAQFGLADAVPVRPPA